MFWLGRRRIRAVSAFSSSPTISLRPIIVPSKTYRFSERTCTTCHFSSISSSGSSSSISGKARVLFLGTPEVAASTLRAVVGESRKKDCLYEVVGVVTKPSMKGKRQEKEAGPVGFVAKEFGIPVLCPEKSMDDVAFLMLLDPLRMNALACLKKAKDVDFLDELEFNVRPDLCIIAAYGQYLPKRFLAIPKFGTINIHPSLLPRWRGASPVQRSLEAGDHSVGVSIIYTVSKMDAGPIISQESCEIDENATATIVLPYLFDVGTARLLKVMPKIINGEITKATAVVQNEENAVNADMIDASEGELRVWEQSARRCHNKCRGFSMWPGTFMYFAIGANTDNDTVKIKIITTRVAADVTEKMELTDEVVLGPKKGDGLLIICGDGSVLEVMELQPKTRKAMSAKSFVNGLHGRSLRWVKMSKKA